MNIMYGLLQYPKVKEHLSFCEEYKRYVDMLINLVSEEFADLEKQEEEILLSKSLGTPYYLYKDKSKKEIEIEFIKKKIDILNKMINDYPNSMEVIKKVSKLVKGNKGIVKELKLSFRNKEVTLTELYVNYLFVLKHIDYLNFNLDVNTKKNK